MGRDKTAWKGQNNEARGPNLVNDLQHVHDTGVKSEVWIDDLSQSKPNAPKKIHEWSAAWLAAFANSHAQRLRRDGANGRQQHKAVELVHRGGTTRVESQDRQQAQLVGNCQVLIS